MAQLEMMLKGFSSLDDPDPRAFYSDSDFKNFIRELIPKIYPEEPPQVRDEIEYEIKRRVRRKS